VLFLDELLEFQRSAIESLGYVLEEGKVTTSRGGQSATFPAQPMLVGAINPCECGYRGARSRTCSCSPERVQKYLARLQDPMFDRFDMRFCLPAPETSEMVGAEPGESSSCVQKRVVAARAFHAERFGEPRRLNGELAISETDRVVALDDSANATLGPPLSSRERARVLRVARTIADLAGSETVRAMHVEEAVVYAVPSNVRTG
jgi:magnesium chelatase family protein